MRFCSISSVQRNIRRWPWEPSCWGLRNIQLFFWFVKMYRCFEANLEGFGDFGMSRWTNSCDFPRLETLRLSQKSRSELTKLLRACEEVPVPQKWARDAQEFFLLGLLGLDDIIPWTCLVVENPPFKGAMCKPWMEGQVPQSPTSFGALLDFFPEISPRCKAHWHCW